MIVDQLYTQPEPTVNSTRIFTEGRHKKLLKEDATYRKFHNLSRMLAERKMSDPEVLALFAAIEAGANAAGGNRTALGRGKDAVAGAYNSVYDAWKANHMKRWPSAVLQPDGTMGLPGISGGSALSPPNLVKESVKLIKLPVSQLIDHKLTVMGWALNESIGKKPGNSVHLTRKGVFTVIENVDRYRRALLKEYKPGPVGPGREALPDLYRPDQPAAPAPVTAKPGMIGRGLNWLDKTTGKVGGYLSKQAQNFTRKVTAAKLKMEWQQLGNPYDSDQIAAFLATQGVPQPVITDVYSKMGIPVTAVAGSQAGGAGIQTGATSLIDPDTGKPFEKRKLAALHNQPAPAPAQQQPGMTQDGTPHWDPATGKGAKYDGVTRQTTPAYQAELDKQKAAGEEHRASATNPNAQPQQAATPVKTANFAGPTGYGKTTMNAPPGIPGMTKPAAGVGGQMELDFSPDDLSSRKLPGKTPAWAKADPTAAWDKNNLTKVSETIKQVKKMLETVQTRDDVNFIKKYINHEFDRQGMVNQLATVQRNHLIERVTQIAAGRRRDHARQLAH